MRSVVPPRRRRADYIRHCSGIQQRTSAIGLKSRRTIWFDAASPPQVLWFSGVANALIERGLKLFITARSHADTAELAQQFLPGLHAVVEGHDPGTNLRKLAAIARRSSALRAVLKEHVPLDELIAVSHNSYAQIVAARTLGIPVLTSMDFEGQMANHIAFRIANRVLLPEAFPEDVAKRQGASERKLRRYSGVKEALYVGSWVDARAPDGSDGDPVAVLRPEADFATYQEGPNPLFPLVVEYLVEAGVRVKVLPRGPEQRMRLSQRWQGNVEIMGLPVHGPELLRTVDLFVGAGGTMTREAAVLGTPSYSIYQGESPAVDRYLEARGILTIISSAADINKISVSRRQDWTVPEIARETKESILAAVNDFIDAYA